MRSCEMYLANMHSLLVGSADIEVPPPRPKRKSSKELNAAATAAAAAAAAGPSGSRKVAEAQAAKTYKDIVPARQSKQPDLDGGIANMADAIATNISNSISSWAAWNDIKVTELLVPTIFRSWKIWPDILDDGLRV